MKKIRNFAVFLANRITCAKRAKEVCAGSAWKLSIYITSIGSIPRHRLKKQCAPAQLALAWVLAQGQDIVPIPGTKRRKYLQENVGALDVDLTSQDLARIDEVAPKGAFAGLRYPNWAMALVNR
jgi:hypothetical protein